MRKVEEWIGKHDDQPVPPLVRARIFETHNGVCHLSGRKIRPGEAWELEHIIALCNGGEHRESNMAPALVQPHKVKTAQDRKIKSKIDRVRKRHIGIRKPRTIRAWRKFDGTPVYASRERRT
jgi:5-methylcytosine-specific restriction endonuclease McrA